MADIFRKSSLEKLSSPEQLDKMIVITPSSFWLSMVGAGIIIVVALIWSIFGRLPQNVDAQGIYINRAGVQSVYCEGSGTVRELLVEDGDAVKKGDVIAVLDTTEVDKKIREYEEKKAAIENVAIDTADQIGEVSTDDAVLALYQDLYQNMNMLKYQTKELDEKRTVLAATEATYLALETEYYNSFNVGDSTKEQLDYQDAQAEYSTASSYMQNAKSAYDQACTQYDAAKQAYEDALEAAEQAYEDAMEAAEQALEAAEDALEAAEQADEAALEAAEQAYEDALDYVDSIPAPEEDPTVLARKAEMNAARAALDEAYSVYREYTADKTSAEQSYEIAKSNYIQKVASIGSTQATQSELGNKYNVIANQYNTEKNAVQSLENSVAQAKIQINVTKSYILSNLKAEYKQYLDQKELSQIKANSDGRISDLAVSVGSVIGQGTEVAKVQNGDDSDRIIVCYIPVGEGRKVQKDMKVLIYPSTVNKQEYGHMEATVLNVDEYITSAADMQKQLGDNNLVEAFMQNGPVVAVTCELKEDASTASGYYWSSHKGASVSIDGGTMVEASVVVSEKAPISMLIPFLKEKLTIKADK